MKKRFKIIALSMGALLLLTLLGVFVFRENIVSSLLNKYVQKLKANYNIELTYADLELNGIGEINLTGVVLAQSADTLGSIDSISVTFPFWRTIFGNRKLNSLHIADGELYPFKYKAVAKDTTQPTGETISRVEKIKGLIRTIKRVLPREVSVTHFNTYTNGKMGIAKYSIDSLTFVNDDFKLVSAITDTFNYTQHFDWFGANIRDSNTIFFDYINRERRGEGPFRLKVSKGTVGFSQCMLLVKLDVDDEVNSEITAYMNDVMVEHYRLAETAVMLNKINLSFNVNLGNKRLDIYTKDTGTRVNQLNFNGKAYYDYKTSKKFGLHLSVSQQPAADYINAIPPHIFKKIDKMQVSGELSYAFNFELDMQHIDSLKFSSELTGYNFKVLNAAQLGLTKMNEPFMHTIKTVAGTYEVGVGEGLPYFTPITQVPRYLIDAILTNEDPSFFHHRGFIESAVRESIITNIKERRFKRGASTISMQLVKNLFLSKEKTIARKVEEILLVWILENKHITPKERMFEVYLNIIEWGPGIYGIEQAADFYFKKKPHQLSLEESLYLASIIPRPKSFKYTFDKEGNIRPHYAEQFRFIKDLMVKRELISPQDTLGFDPYIKLKGEARRQVLPDEQYQLIEKVEDFFENLF